MTIEDLKTFGANTQEGLARCMNNEAFYLRMIDLALKSEHFDQLTAALEAGNLEQAFEVAHSWKGVLGNLSLTPVYEPVSEITELLRSRTQTDYSDLLKTIGEKWQALLSL